MFTQYEIYKYLIKNCKYLLNLTFKGKYPILQKYICFSDKSGCFSDKSGCFSDKSGSVKFTTKSLYIHYLIQLFNNFFLFNQILIQKNSLSNSMKRPHFDCSWLWRTTYTVEEITWQNYELTMIMNLETLWLQCTVVWTFTLLILGSVDCVWKLQKYKVKSGKSLCWFLEKGKLKLTFSSIINISSKKVMK